MPAAKRSLFQSTVIRLRKVGAATTFFIANHPEKGWASYGVEYPTLDALLDEYDVRLGAWGEDGCSVFVEAHPRAQAEA